MSCSTVTLSTIDARCDGSVGGIKRILIANRDDVTFAIGSTSNPNELVTSITKATGKKFEQWRFRRNTGSYTSTVTKDVAIGTDTCTTEVSLQFSRAEAEKRLAIQSAINANSVVLVEDMYGQVIFLGAENDVVITSAVMQSGTNASDLSGFTLTMEDVSTELPHFVDTTNVDIESLLVVDEPQVG